MTATIPILLLGVLAGAGLGALVALWYARRSADTLRGEMQAAFSALSQDALQRSNSTLLQTADQALRARQEAIDALVGPVKETLDKMRAQVADADKQREGSYQAVRTQLSTLAQAQEHLRQATEGLSRSLRSPNTRGRWGEFQLQRIAELAGMLEHCDFVQQQPGDDSRLKPDMTVRLPGGARIVVDAKVPIEAYMRAVEATTDEARRRAQDDHAAQVRQHIKALGQKEYWKQFDQAPEFVVLFLPLEPLMSAAFERDGELLEFAARSSVVLATPMTLLALLRAVAFGWQQHSLARNAEEIREVGQELCDRLLKMLEHFDEAGDDLGKAVAAFNRAVGSFDNRVMPSVRRFQALKVPGAAALEAPEERPAGVRAFRKPSLLEDDGDEHRRLDF